MTNPSIGPSEHLSWAEIACHDDACTPYPAVWRVTRAVALAAVFEAIREEVGAPITIGSGYRTPAHNKAIGGRPHSQHIQGRAIDLHTPAGWSLQAFHDAVRVVARRDKRIGGVGFYGWGCHVDVRYRKNPARYASWNGIDSFTSSTGQRA